MVSNQILVVMPTRGRRWSALETIASMMKNCSNPSLVDILICQDEDDTDKFTLTAKRVATVIRRRKKFIGWMNFAAKRDLSVYEWMTWGADDIKFLTPGWDNLVREHKELVVYGEDGIQNESMATHPFFRVEIPLALGYLLPSELVHLCADTFIEALAREIGSIAYDPAIKMEHLHFVVGKSVEDQTYKDAGLHWESDKATFETVIRPTIPALAEKVKKYIADKNLREGFK